MSQHPKKHHSPAIREQIEKLHLLQLRDKIQETNRWSMVSDRKNDEVMRTMLRLLKIRHQLKIEEPAGLHHLKSRELSLRTSHRLKENLQRNNQAPQVVFPHPRPCLQMMQRKQQETHHLLSRVFQEISRSSKAS